MAGEIRLGTSSFTADGWNGSFYPKGMKSADYLHYYSSRFDTVEVDSTFYRCPTMEAVKNWALKTPPGFIFSLKIPRTRHAAPRCEARLLHRRGYNSSAASD